MLSKRSWLVIGVAAVLLTGGGIIFCTSEPQGSELLLSDYPDLFERDALIIVGSNASPVELESAAAIASNLQELVGNTPQVKHDVETSTADKIGHNLILVGTPGSNSVLEEVYEITSVARVTGEYPGDSKGFLEVLRNPWEAAKALLVVAASDGQGIEYASDTLVVGGFIITDNHALVPNKYLAKIESPLLDKLRSKPVQSQVGVYVSFWEKPGTAEIHELSRLGVELDMKHWIPPVGSHPYGSAPARLRLESLYAIAKLQCVVFIESAEKPKGFQDDESSGL